MRTAWRIAWKLGLAILVGVFTLWPIGVCVAAIAFFGGSKSSGSTDDEAYGDDGGDGD